MLTSCASSTGTKGFSIGDDKLKHLSYSAGISAVTAAYYRQQRDEERCNAAAIGFGITMSFGAGKEIYDKYIKKTRWDWEDVSWDFVGSTIGSLAGSGCH